MYHQEQHVTCFQVHQKFLSEHKNIVGIKEAVCDKDRIKDLIKISIIK